MRPIFIALAALVLSGCTVLSGGISGQLEDGSETFTGKVSEKLTGGTLSLTTSKGATCDGTFLRTQDNSQAKGIFKCSDGRSGTFRLVTAPFQKAYGTGDLGGRPITMTLE